MTNKQTRHYYQNAIHGELISFIVFGFNQEELIETTIRAAFAQTYQPLEIILSDNCSDDETYQIMERLAKEYQGPHTIRLNQNSNNRGFIGHVNQAFELCNGVLIIYNPGDDVSIPERTSELYEAFRNERPLLVHSDVFKMTSNGMLTGHIFSQKGTLARLDLLGFARSSSLAIGSSCAWNPELMTVFGQIHYENTFDDLVFSYRARLLGRIAYVEKPLVYYRYGASLSKSVSKDLIEIRENYRSSVLRMIDTYKQRLGDTYCVAGECHILIHKLKNYIKEAEFKLFLLDSGRSFAWSGFTSWSKFRTMLSHINKLRKISSPCQIEKNSRHNEGYEK